MHPYWQTNFPKNTYGWQLITLSTSVSHRHSKLTGNRSLSNRKYHYQRYASLPHVTATLFARHSSLTALTSISDFNIPSYTLPCKNGSRQLLACPHSGSAYPTRPVCIYIFNFQGTLRQTSFCLFWIKSFLDLSAQKAHKHSPSAMNGSVKIMCFSGMTSL